jgi:hypothetical protein
MRPRIAFAVLALTAFGTQARAQSARVEIVPTAGWLFPGDLARGPLGSALRAAHAPLLAGTAAVRIAGPVSLWGGVSFADSELELGLPLAGGVPLTDTRLIVLDAGIQLRGHGPAAPVLQLGLGSMHYRFATGLVDVRADNVVVSVAAGMDLAIAPGLALRFLARDWVGRFDSSDAIIVDLPARSAHNLALSAGLRLAL